MLHRKSGCLVCKTVRIDEPIVRKKQGEREKEGPR